MNLQDKIQAKSREEFPEIYNGIGALSVDLNLYARTAYIKGLTENVESFVSEREELIKKVNQLWENSSQKSSQEEIAVSKFHLKVIELLTPEK